MIWITENLGGVFSGLFWGIMKKSVWRITYFVGGIYDEVEEKAEEEEEHTQNRTQNNVFFFNIYLLRYTKMEEVREKDVMRLYGHNRVVTTEREVERATNWEASQFVILPHIH